ncbi:MAG TPA: oxidoreductase, partial [Clostridiaceae bacterium]|nr:oxidoreductase [Clostridiaceae bacterium]HCL50319.1 oxidoreductase [Clostridiaceae bacterium]
MKKLRFAIIGCGRISYKHIEGLINNREEAELVAVCDIDINKAAKRKNDYESSIKDAKVKTYMDY